MLRPIDRQQPVTFRCPMEQLLHRQRDGSRPNLRRAAEIPWCKRLLRVALGDCQLVELHSGVGLVDVRESIGRAIATWNAVGLPIAIELLESPVGEMFSLAQPDVIVAWFMPANDPEGMFAGTAHAHADYPPGNTLFGGPPLPLHFNASVPWGNGEPGCFDIETIALHELAHVLGLIYHSGPDSILYEAIPPAPLGLRRVLDPETTTRAHALYGDTPASWRC